MYHQNQFLFMNRWLFQSYHLLFNRYWLLLRGGIVQSALCIAAIFWYIVRSHLRFNHSWFIHRVLWQTQTEHLVAKQGKAWRKSSLILPAKYLCHTSQESLTCHKILRHVYQVLTSPPKEGFLSALKTHRLRPALNLRTLGKMASTIITGPPRTTFQPVLRQKPGSQSSDNYLATLVRCLKSYSRTTPKLNILSTLIVVCTKQVS
jgi:hypothetical protein